MGAYGKSKTGIMSGGGSEAVYGSAALEALKQFQLDKQFKKIVFIINVPEENSLFWRFTFNVQ